MPASSDKWGTQSLVFRQTSWVCPYPVAVTCSRIVRSRSAESLLDSILKAAEVLTRYLAAAALASYAARNGDDPSPPGALKEFSGPLSFGHFLSVVQQLAKTSVDHPLRAPLAAGFAPKTIGKETKAGSADIALAALLELRNELGHKLMSISAARAKSVLREHRPDEALEQALEGVQYLLGFPLFVIEDQRHTQGRLVARRLLLMGDSPDPEPEEIVLSSPVAADGSPYLGMKNGALLLMPMLRWQIVPVAQNFKLFVLDAVAEDSLKYETVEANTIETNGADAESLRTLLAGERRPLESAALVDGRDFASEWTERRKGLVTAREQIEGQVTWQDFDQDLVRWFAHRLAPERGAEKPQVVIQERLLDGRDRLSPRDANQMALLFGRKEQIRPLLGRELIDMRAMKSGAGRWDERTELHVNIIKSLQMAVDFFSRHVGVSGSTIDGLSATSGSADYIAMREALVNLFIHQDYSDPSAAAQIEIHPDRAMFLNPGRSLVSASALIEGGKSQARNPLIARALRLVGFAELAGSGLRELQRVWRVAKRRPPRFESNPSANTFSLTLDWREVPDAYDSFWKDRIGVALSEPEARVLNLSLAEKGVTVEEAASATGVTVEDAGAIVQKLATQVLVDERKGRYYVKEHLKKLVH